MVERHRQRSGEGRPKVEDIARVAGVSTATVSRVLNGSNLVSADLTARVQAHVKALGYVRHGAALALTSSRSRTIGAVIPTLNNAIFAAGIEAFGSALEQAGYTLLVAVSNYNLDSEVRQIRRLLERGVDAFMLVGNDHREETFQALAFARVPHVATWSTGSDRCANVGFDNRIAATAIVDHLVGLGHRRFAMIAGIAQGNDRAADRILGVCEGLAGHGLALDGGRLIERDYSINAGREALTRLLTLYPRPTAVICGNDVLALGALFEAEAREVAVPDALSVTGFDNLPLTTHVQPALTTIDVPFEEMGRSVAEALLDALENGTAIVGSCLLDAPLLVRATTAPAP